MTTTAQGSTGGVQKELLEAGSYVARCYSLVDVGTHQNDKFMNAKTGKPQEQRKIRITFEIPSELRVFDEANGEQPMVLGKTYTLSLSDKAYLRKDLESWRGKSFTEDEMKGFNLSNLVGIPCIISVGIGEYDGKEFNQINGISPLMKGQTADEQINPSTIFDLDDYTIESFNKLPNFLKKKISESIEGSRCEYEEVDKKISMIKKIVKEEAKEPAKPVDDDLSF